MEIPYVVDERPDTGLTNVKLGIWLFLASEVMLFGGLFSSYILLRINAVEWPLGSDILNVPIGAFNTVVLISSSVTMVLSYASLKLDDLGGFKRYMAAETPDKMALWRRLNPDVPGLLDVFDDYLAARGG